MTGETHCPVCASDAIAPYHEDGRRPYLQCGNCGLVFVPPGWYLTPQDELAQYNYHQNDVGDVHYRQFLSRLAIPLIARLAPGAHGLDFGCGPGPALAHMLREAGFGVALYDKFFYPDDSVLRSRRYAFICATEVVEHLHQPGLELERLWSLLQPGGWLGIMTKLVSDQAAFARWHYKNDPTHVCFFSAQTWRWWAQAHAASLELVGADVILLRREEST
jgi:2-polyprenyl-3-methyl-5-hydroxy-6-metoxy-1,4-benzoquinol methylase